MKMKNLMFLAARKSWMSHFLGLSQTDEKRFSITRGALKSKFLLVILACCAALFLRPTASLAVPIIREDQTNNEYQKEAKCTGPTSGGTTLIDLPKDMVSANEVPGLIDTLRWQYSGATKPGTGNPPMNRPADQRWTFDFGTPLKGKLFIERYIAGDTEDGDKCIHGANFDCRYEKDPNDPSVDFVQMVQISMPFKDLAAGQKHIDPYPDLGADDSPYYYPAGDPRNRIIPNPPGTVVFEDLPEIKFKEKSAHSSSEKFWLVLASTNDKKMILHDAVEWGWSGGCVPEPATVFLLGLGGLVLLRRRRKA